jgi:hypothetical protein
MGGDNLEAFWNYDRIISSIEGLTKELGFNTFNYVSTISKFYKLLFNNSFLEYIGVTVSENCLENIKCYFSPKGAIEMDEFYNGTSLNIDSINTLINDIKSDKNVKLLDFSFSNLCNSYELDNYRFAFRLENHSKMIAKESMNHIINLLGFNDCLDWIHSIAETIEDEINTYKYPFYLAGFDYNIKNKNIDMLKIYYLGRYFLNSESNINSGIYKNKEIRNVINKLDLLKDKNITKEDILQYYDKLDNLGLKFKLIGINIDKNHNFEFKIYFDIIQSTWNIDTIKSLYETMDSLLNYKCSCELNNIFNIFGDKKYIFKGLGISFLSYNRKSVKLYFSPSDYYKDFF